MSVIFTLEGEEWVGRLVPGGQDLVQLRRPVTPFSRAFRVAARLFW